MQAESFVGVTSHKATRYDTEGVESESGGKTRFFLNCRPDLKRKTMLTNSRHYSFGERTIEKDPAVSSDELNNVSGALGDQAAQEPGTEASGKRSNTKASVDGRRAAIGAVDSPRVRACVILHIVGRKRKERVFCGVK